MGEMQFKNCAGFLYGPLHHHLDHLAPFCSLQKIPLIVTDEGIAEQITSYYPDLQLLHWNCIEAPFKTVQTFDTLVYTIPRPFYEELFFIAESTHHKKLKTIWLPHGNSDKGHHSLFMEGLKDETTLLVYGQKMVDFLHLKRISKPSIPVGNYRFEYYLRHRSFYNALIDPWIVSETKTLFYAPTWQDGENSTSFFEMTQALITQLPNGYTLWIKPHPNHENDIRTEQLILLYPHIRFIRNFTPIYPLLDKADIYLGDFSSIGYDFLTFNRPMFFFNQNHHSSDDPSRTLHKCGDTLDPNNIYQALLNDPDQSHLTQVRQELYNYTYHK
jgi:hypothetical protein